MNDKNSNSNDTQSIIDKIGEKEIEFELYEVFLYSRNGNFICNTKNKNIWANNIFYNDIDNEENGENNFYNNDYNNNEIDTDEIISKIIKTICLYSYKESKNKGINYNIISFTGIKISIVNIFATNLIALGIFSQKTKSSITRLFLLNLIVSFINYTGDKHEFFNSKQFNEINSLNKMNNENYMAFLQSKIYDTFLSIPLQIHFERLSKTIFKRRGLYAKDIFYKNFHLIDLDNDKIILSLESLHDKYSGKEPSLKISDHHDIWKHLIFHCHNLKHFYIKKNNMIFNKMDYQNFFVKIEYKATFPRRNFIIKFLPLLNGMCIIHEYIQFKLSTFEGEETKVYNEISIIHGYYSCNNAAQNNFNRYFENEHIIIKNWNNFIIESLFCSNNSTNFFILSRKPKIYFSEEILAIIDKEVNDYFKSKENMNNKINSYEISTSNSNYTNEIMNRIINVLYDEFIQINTNSINNSNNDIYVRRSSIKSSYNKMDRKSLIKEIEKLNKEDSLQITKNETLIALFNSIQFNQNINPNNLTLDLNNERISQLRITHNIDNDELPSSLKSDSLNPKNAYSSDWLRESVDGRKNYIKSSYDKTNIDSKFPYDTRTYNSKSIGFDEIADYPYDGYNYNNGYNQTNSANKLYLNNPNSRNEYEEMSYNKINRYQNK